MRRASTVREHLCRGECGLQLRSAETATPPHAQRPSPCGQRRAPLIRCLQQPKCKAAAFGNSVSTPARKPAGKLSDACAPADQKIGHPHPGFYSQQCRALSPPMRSDRQLVLRLPLRHCVPHNRCEQTLSPLSASSSFRQAVRIRVSTAQRTLSTCTVANEAGGVGERRVGRERASVCSRTRVYENHVSCAHCVHVGCEAGLRVHLMIN